MPPGRNDAVATGMTELVWVFGYGSLMWRPGFEPAARVPTRISGFHRWLCMESHSRWGTPEAPGLVMGLLPGGSCKGLALGVEREAAADVLAYLDGREGPPYRRGTVRLRIGGRAVEAITYLSRADHPMFVGKLPADEAARKVRAGNGTAGSSREYLENTVRYLADVGIADRGLLGILRSVEAVDGGT